MPYIKPDSRMELEVSQMCRGPFTAGELNYAVTDVVCGYISGRELSYRLINDVLGALEGAKLEFYRRVAAPYEDGKCLENGDVY